MVCFIRPNTRTLPTVSTLTPTRRFSEIRVFFIKFMTIFTMRFLLATMTFFLNHISKIICLSSKKKMFWINTRTIVTFMANEITNWYFANPKLVRNSIGLIRFFVNTKLTVSPYGARWLPLHTSGWRYV